MNGNECVKVAERLGELIAKVEYGSVGVELTIHGKKVVKTNYSLTEKIQETSTGDKK